MQSFTEYYLSERMVITPRINFLVGQIREFKGKQDLYAERRPEILDNLKQVAFIESVESSNRLERIETSKASLKKILRHQIQPQNRPQYELAGYRDVLDGLHNHHAAMPFKVSVVKQMHRDLFAYTSAGGGEFKQSPNDIVEKDQSNHIVRVRFRTVEPFMVEPAMDRLHDGFNRALQEFDPLVLIPSYVHDFLCIHPFSDGNGRMARLLTVLLLYRHGFDVTRYVSLERLIEESKNAYYNSLSVSDIGWHEGTHDHTAFCEYLLGVILAAYRKLEEEVDVKSSRRGSKTKLVQQSIDGLPEYFTIADVENRCPSVSRDTIRNVLRQLSTKNEIKNIEKGRNARWKKIG